MSKTVKVRVPATTANLGPGFDCLGMALDMWNTIQVKIGSEEITIYGEGSRTLNRGKRNLVYRSTCIPFKEVGLPIPKLSISCNNQIPLSRGLGSSSAAIVSGLVAGNELCGRLLTRDRILELATEIEGHPDNVTPALLGGCRIVVSDNGHLVTGTVPVPDVLTAVLFIPGMPMPTRQARNILSPTVTRGDAVYNIGRAALVVSSFATGNLETLAVATQDRLHQPARQAIFPAMSAIFTSALDAGALGTFLSGGGSTILALAKENQQEIGEAMAQAAKSNDMSGLVSVVAISKLGAHVVEAS